MSEEIKDEIVNLTGDPLGKGTEIQRKKKRKLGRRHSSSIVKIFSSWGCFKNIGQAGLGTDNRLRLDGTDYVMIIPAKAEYTWQVTWRKVGFVDLSKVKRVKENRRVSFKEVMDNIPEDLRQKFEENIELFLVPRDSE